MASSKFGTAALIVGGVGLAGVLVMKRKQSRITVPVAPAPLPASAVAPAPQQTASNLPQQVQAGVGVATALVSALPAFGISFPSWSQDDGGTAFGDE